MVEQSLKTTGNYRDFVNENPAGAKKHHTGFPFRHLLPLSVSKIIAHRLKIGTNFAGKYSIISFLNGG